MDPNVTLSELREAIVELGRLNTADAPDDVHHATTTALERWSALDTWISNGGFLPREWGEAQRRVKPKEQCWELTLAGTRSPMPCPPEHEVEDVMRLLDGDPWRP